MIASPRLPRDLLSLPRARISPREGSATQRAVGGHGQCPLGEGGNQYPSRDRAYGSRFPFPFSRLPCGGSRAILEIDGGTPQPFPSTLKVSACETGIVPDEATIAFERALSNDRSAEPIENEQHGPARENVTATTRGFQTAT